MAAAVVGHSTPLVRAAAEPPPALLEAIADAPAGPIASICVMNVAMSAATECGHLRNGDADAAAGSALTNKRAVNLVRALVQGQESGPHVGRPSACAKRNADLDHRTSRVMSQ